MMNDEYKKCPAGRVRIPIYHSQFIIHHFSLPHRGIFWRRERDSNPRTGISRHTISSIVVMMDDERLHWNIVYHRDGEKSREIWLFAPPFFCIGKKSPIKCGVRTWRKPPRFSCFFGKMANTGQTLSQETMRHSVQHKNQMANILKDLRIWHSPAIDK